MPAGRDHRNPDLARKLDGRVDVDAGQHAVAADVGVDDRFDAVILELLREIDDVVPGHLRPAVGRHLAVARVEADDDVPGKRRARIVQEPGVLDGGGADDHVRDAVVEIALDRVEVADAAAQLHRNLLADHADDLADRELVLRHARDRPVQVDQMEPLGTLLEPVLRHRRGILGKDGRRMHLALPQAHAMSVLDVDRGDDLHWRDTARGEDGAGEDSARGVRGYASPFQTTKLARSCNPARWLFSGWNCVAKILARAIAQVNAAG